MRGKALAHIDALSLSGITPAYAGKSCCTRWTVPQRPDHPRVCGEKTLPDADEEKAKGSPPRMRGKVSRSISSRMVEGITPAYAGKRVRSVSWSCRSRDHPRVCGEKIEL